METPAIRVERWILLGVNGTLAISSLAVSADFIYVMTYATCVPSATAAILISVGTALCSISFLWLWRVRSMLTSYFAIKRK